MAALTESLLVEASLKEAWDFYFEPTGWPAWVDGFHSIEDSGGYPDDGGTLVWRSTHAGRGTVRERVLEHSPRTRHRIAFSDPAASGELEVRFAIQGDATRVTLRLDYSLAAAGPFTRFSDRFFVRGQMRGSLQRTLLRFKHEVEEAAVLGGRDDALDARGE